MPGFELLIQERPLTLQTRTRSQYQRWKERVSEKAAEAWVGRPVYFDSVRLTIVTLCREPVMDADNVIKPIQDALIGLVYADDRQVTDVDSHRRMFGDGLDVSGAPPLLLDAAVGEIECVYVRVEAAPRLEEVL